MEGRKRKVNDGYVCVWIIVDKCENEMSDE